MNTWDEIKGHVASKISPGAYDNWLSKTVFLRSEGHKIWVSVPDPATKDCIVQEYSSEIWSTVHDLTMPLRQIVYEVQHAAPTAERKILGEEKSKAVPAPSINLFPKCSFDTF